MKYILAAICALAISNSYASEWWLVSITDENAFFIDTSSIKKTDSGAIKAWTRVVSKDETAREILWFYNCDSEEAGIKSSISYKKDGSVENSIAVNSISYEPVAPDTNNNIHQNIACSEDPVSQLNKPYQFKLKDGDSPNNVAKHIFKKIRELNSPPLKKRK